MIALRPDELREAAIASHLTTIRSELERARDADDLDTSRLTARVALAELEQLEEQLAP